MFGLEEPCGFCTSSPSLIDKENSYQWEYYNPVLKKHFMVVNKIMQWPDGRNARSANIPQTYEVRFRDRSGNIKNLIMTISQLNGTNNSVVALLDITERKLMEEQLRYLSYNDSLTGIYNRTYFQKELRCLDGEKDAQIAIIVSDVDGLKIINDSMGQEAGDALLVAVSKILIESIGDGDIVARIGGDEFAVLLPDGTKETAENVCLKIKERVLKFNLNNLKVPLNISMGFAAGNTNKVSTNELLKEADYNMSREKLHHHCSTRSFLVQTLSKALEVRDFITEGHAERLQDLVTQLALTMGLSEMRIQADLRLFAQFHDIGKVGIPDQILFKNGPLTLEEMVIMKRHCEIGYRIAQASPDLLPIAEWILKHHEWWNGKGYPLGLKGEEIPLECRILAIADAYDAMTNDRPYRKALTREEALSEIKKCSGTQFDPRLVDMFLKMMQG